MGTDGYVLVYRAEKRFYNASLTAACPRLFPRLLTGGKPVTTSQYQASVAGQFPFVDFQKLLLGSTGSVAKTEFLEINKGKLLGLARSWAYKVDVRQQPVQNAKRKSLRMFMFAKIMQIERKILSLLEYFAVIQPIL